MACCCCWSDGEVISEPTSVLCRCHAVPWTSLSLALLLQMLSLGNLCVFFPKCSLGNTAWTGNDLHSAMAGASCVKEQLEQPHIKPPSGCQSALPCYLARSSTWLGHSWHLARSNSLDFLICCFPRDTEAIRSAVPSTLNKSRDPVPLLALL